MWFKVLKNTARNRAYDSFIRSFILYDGISLKIEDLESVGTGLVRWYTPNRAFYWDLRKQHHWFPFEITLGTTIAEHEPYLPYIKEAIMDEYPDNWKVFSELVRKEREEIAKLFRHEEVEEEEMPNEALLTKGVFREFKYMFAEFQDAMMDNISKSLGYNIANPNRTRRKLREIFSFRPHSRHIKKEYERLNPPPHKIIHVLLLAPFLIFKKHIENNYPYIVWEHIANFHAEYLIDMENIISVGGSGGQRNTIEREISYVLDNDLTETAYSVTNRLWADNYSERDLLMDNLPLDTLGE